LSEDQIQLTSLLLSL